MEGCILVFDPMQKPHNSAIYLTATKRFLSVLSLLFMVRLMEIIIILDYDHKCEI